MSEYKAYMNCETKKSFGEHIINDGQDHTIRPRMAKKKRKRRETRNQ